MISAVFCVVCALCVYYVCECGLCSVCVMQYVVLSLVGGSVCVVGCVCV